MSESFLLSSTSQTIKEHQSKDTMVIPKVSDRDMNLSGKHDTNLSAHTSHEGAPYAR